MTPTICVRKIRCCSMIMMLVCISSISCSSASTPQLACFLGARDIQDATLDIRSLATCTPEQPMLNTDCWNVSTPQARILCEHFLQQRSKQIDDNASWEDPCNAQEHVLRYTDVCSATQDAAAGLSNMLPRTRQFSMQSVDATPSMHRSAICEGCAYDGNQGNGATLIVNDPLGAHAHVDSQIIGTNRWSDFMRTSGLPIFTKAKVVTSSTPMVRCARRVSQPAIIFDLLGWHVGHLIIDVLEALYEAMRDLRDRGKEPLLFIDVADKDNLRLYSGTLMSNLVFGRTRQSTFSLLRHFSNFTIHSKRALDLLPGLTCFDDSVQIQLDVQDTFSVRGPDLSGLAARRQHYSALRSFLTEAEGIRQPAPQARPLATPRRVTVVKRAGSRIVTNFDAVVEAMKQVDNVVVRVVALEKMAFAEQMTLFAQGTDVLVCQQGTAAHNAMFMPEGASLVLWMQPGWCAWHWQFTSQAMVGSQRAVAVCQSPKVAPLQSVEFPVRWGLKSWRQGPWWSKDVSMSVNITLAQHALRLAILAETDESYGAPFLLGSDLREVEPSAFAEEPLGNDQGSECEGDRALPVRPVLAQFDTAVSHPDEPAFVYKAVFEAAFRMPDVQTFPSISKQENFMADSRLCVRLWRSDTCPSRSGQAREAAHEFSCFASETFNEFASLDFRIEDSSEDSGWVIEAWFESDAAQKEQLVSKRALYQRLMPALAGKFRLSRPVSVGRSSVPVRTLADLQAAVAQDCKGDVNSCACVALARRYGEQLAQSAAVERAGLWPPPLHVPRIETPFVFLHLEKTAGTCFRNILDQVSQADPEVQAFLPCHGGVPCMTFSMSDAPPSSSVIGGHFEFGAWKPLLSPGAQAYCATIQRHPVARVISFYYERVFPSLQVRLNELPEANLTFVMEQWRGSAFGRWRDEGLSNAGCKMMCGIREYRGFLPEESPNPQSLEAAECTPDLAVRRLEDECLIGMQERWEDTLQVFSYFLPWASAALRQGCPATTHGSNRRAVVFETIETLSDTARRVIEEHNQCDLALYARAQEKFERQLGVVQSLGSRCDEE